MKQVSKVVVVLVGMLVAGVCMTVQGQSQGSSNQQVQDPSQPKRPLIKATGTPQQALPTPTTSNTLPDEQQATKEEVEELLDVMRVEDQMNDMLGVFPIIVEQQQHSLYKSYEAQIAALTPDQKAQVGQLKKKYEEKAEDVYSVTEMLADLTKIYQNHLNSVDVESLITFYSSDAAQHLLEAQPEILKEYIPLLTARIAKKADDLQAQQKKDLDALLASFKAGKK